jgi:hypothetical protein
LSAGGGLPELQSGTKAHKSSKTMINARKIPGRAFMFSPFHLGGA